MANEKFNVGDVVRLKSGGPVMTVVSISKNEWLVCNWFDDKDKPHSGEYPPAALEEIELGKVEVLENYLSEDSY